MLDIVLKGILIGVLISAPMGPIGVMCIQRTLNEGRIHGFFTGLGATFSDIAYAVIAGLGMGFIIDFLETNLNPIQIIGSVFILLFGYYTFKTNPARTLKKQGDKTNPLWKDFITSFFLNLSNIGILLFFIALFARFNFIDSENQIQNVVGIASVGLGTVIWWFGISYVVSKLRGRFNPRGLMIFNRILGSVLIGIAIVGLVTGIYGWIEA